MRLTTTHAFPSNHLPASQRLPAERTRTGSLSRRSLPVLRWSFDTRLAQDAIAEPSGYPIVLETEESGAVSAYVPGLPVYAAADSHAKAERAIRAVLAEYLKEHPASRPEARVRVARVSDRGKAGISIVGVAALVGAKRSDAKARASRANGRLGGRPRKSGTSRTARTKASR